MLRFFTSIKLAAALIAILALGGALATLVPQDLAAADYRAVYGASLGGFLVLSGMTRYFRSFLFIAPAFFFFANLSACTVNRFIRELRKKKGAKRHGPDILHIGLMLLVVGSLVSASGRREYTVVLAPGQRALLPDGRVLILESFDSETYADGRPRDWTSAVTILREGRPEIEGRGIRVNRPLRLGAISLYQDSHAIEAELSGIRAVVDPGYPLVLAALVVVAGGAVLSFARGKGDRKP